MPDLLKSFVAKRLEELGMNPFEAARNGGLERGYINDILQGKKRTIKGDNMVKLANALRVSMRDFIVGTSDTVPIEPMLDWVDQNYKHLENFKNTERNSNQEPQKDQAPKGYVPVFSTALMSDNGIIVEQDVLTFERAPDPLLGVQGAYAFIMYSEYMEPEISAGDKVFVHPKLPPIRNSTCIFYNTSKKENNALVGRLKENKMDAWRIQQWNPPTELDLSKTEWSVCQRIIGKLTI